jgi:hypothetical protein
VYIRCVQSNSAGLKKQILMLSKASFDLDAQNNPIVKLEIASTPDVRDKIANRFVQDFGHTSQWCEILVCGNSEYWIWPIKPEELRRVAAMMIEKADELERKTAQYATLVESASQ